MVEQVFLSMGEVWSVHNANTYYTVEGEQSLMDREEFLCLNFSCLAIKYEFYFLKETKEKKEKKKEGRREDFSHTHLSLSPCHAQSCLTL